MTDTAKTRYEGIIAVVVGVQAAMMLASKGDFNAEQVEVCIARYGAVLEHLLDQVVDERVALALAKAKQEGDTV